MTESSVYSWEKLCEDLYEEPNVFEDLEEGPNDSGASYYEAQLTTGVLQVGSKWEALSTTLASDVYSGDLRIYDAEAMPTTHDGVSLKNVYLSPVEVNQRLKEHGFPQRWDPQSPLRQTSKIERQKAAILQTISTLGLDPTRLHRPAGKTGDKRQVRDECLKKNRRLLTKNSFDDAWAELLKGGDIANAE
mgnify:CR=1 FL=1